MSEHKRYVIPAAICRVAEEIKRSRFITTLAHTPTQADARAFIAGIQAEFPDASHHCWAYLIGPPGHTGMVGISDDGEPHGTAGRPMLTVLTHSGIGDVAVVITRYFGGTKLGTGGLVRAYSSGVQQAIKQVVCTERVAYGFVQVMIDYARVTLFKRLLPQFEAQIETEVFASAVTYGIKLPEEHQEAFGIAVKNLTHGQAVIEEQKK